MKNKIYNSLNNIFPSDSQKQKMLQNIMRPKEQLGGKIFTLATISICLLFTFILFSNEKESNIPTQLSVARLSNEEIISYDNECYELTDFQSMKIGKKVGYYEEYEVYQLDKMNIALVKQNVYKMYRNCERN